jgi:hypothetical protein
MPPRVPESEEAAAQRCAMALLSLIVILSLAIAGVLLVRALEKKSRLEDCLLSGRTNCAPIEVPLRGRWSVPDGGFPSPFARYPSP